MCVLFNGPLAFISKHFFDFILGPSYFFVSLSEGIASATCLLALIMSNSCFFGARIRCGDVEGDLFLVAKATVLPDHDKREREGRREKKNEKSIFPSFFFQEKKERRENWDMFFSFFSLLLFPVAGVRFVNSLKVQLCFCL